MRRRSTSPRRSAGRWGVGLAAVLGQVVDDEEVRGPAGEAAADADGQDAAVVAVEGPLVDGAVVGCDPQPELGVMTTRLRMARPLQVARAWP